MKTKEEKLKLALKRDFNDLYVPQFTSDFFEQRILRNTEIDIMKFKNTLNLIAQTREETIREIIGMCVNFDDYNNDQIISKEMLEELLNKLKK